MIEIMLLRMSERILAVIIGGICIFLGYRLFLCIPEQKEGEGKIGFPGGISIHIARVGPGVFFTLFGAVIVGISFFKPIYIDNNVTAKVAPREQPGIVSDVVADFSGMGSPTQVTEQEARADARAKLRKDMELLNSLPNYLRADLSPQDRTRVDLSMSRIKFALMKPVWGEMSEGWGKTEEFKEWLQKGELDPPPASQKNAVEFYHLGRELKP